MEGKVTRKETNNVSIFGKKDEYIFIGPSYDLEQARDCIKLYSLSIYIIKTSCRDGAR